MENKITGRNPQPIPNEDAVTFENNLSAQELCEQVKVLTAEAREALLQQALTVSNEKCNNLLLQQNALIEELTRQVRSVKLREIALENYLSENNEKMLKDLQRSNGNLLESLKATIRQITEVAAQIQAEVSIAMARTTDEASIKFNKRINEAADKAIAKIDELTAETTNKVKYVCKEIDGVKNEIYYERGFRKFFFWVTPILLLVQSAVSVFLLLR